MLRGRLGVTLDGRYEMLAEGTEVTVPSGVAHDWWNAGDEEAHVLVDVRPGRRFELMVSTLFELARAGRTNTKGLPNPLQLAVIAREFSDVVRFTKSSPVMQAVVLPPLAALGWALGYRPVYREYQDPQGYEAPDGGLLALLRATDMKCGDERVSRMRGGDASRTGLLA